MHMQERLITAFFVKTWILNLVKDLDPKIDSPTEINFL